MNKGVFVIVVVQYMLMRIAYVVLIFNMREHIFSFNELKMNYMRLCILLNAQ